MLRGQMNSVMRSQDFKCMECSFPYEQIVVLISKMHESRNCALDPVFFDQPADSLSDIGERMVERSEQLRAVGASVSR